MGVPQSVGAPRSSTPLRVSYRGGITTSVRVHPLVLTLLTVEYQRLPDDMRATATSSYYVLTEVREE